MDPVLTPDVLAKLRRTRPYPALSLLMPTHRREPDNTQDPVRLRNLVAEAEEALDADPAVSRERRADVLDQLRQAVGEVDLAHAEDGLVVFAAQGEHHVWSVSRTVPERVVLADTFLTRNLVAAQAAAQPYWALALASDRVSLWNGSPASADEHTGDGFPLTRTLADPDADRKERIGDLPSTFQDEATRQFLREAHDKLRAVLASEPRPLYVIGAPAALSLLESLGPLAPGTLTIQHGGLADGPSAAVREAVEPVRAKREAASTATVVAELNTARGRREFAGGIDEVWQAVKEGRMRLLALEEHYRTVVRDEGGHLEPADRSDDGARDDMVDEIVEQALERGAEVRFVPDGTLSDQGRIAGALRY
ncbi:chemotaxis protein [Streptomyces sp. NPDC085481]|uniref:baeRF3 domain-containing protein n=1 Tax=Streptomyces sp. NPDC085481 TaxID=3365727 RepID=UPI0037D9658F